MADVTVRVVNGRQLRSELRRAAGNLDDLKDANARAAALVAREAGPAAPRRTGRLASTVRGNRAAGRATVTVGSAAVPYARPIHWGWPARGIEADPWVADTAVRTEPVWLDYYQHDVQTILDRIG